MAGGGTDKQVKFTFTGEGMSQIVASLKQMEEGLKGLSSFLASQASNAEKASKAVKETATATEKVTKASKEAKTATDSATKSAKAQTAAVKETGEAATVATGKIQAMDRAALAAKRNAEALLMSKRAEQLGQADQRWAQVQSDMMIRLAQKETMLNTKKANDLETIEKRANERIRAQREMSADNLMASMQRKLVQYAVWAAGIGGVGGALKTGMMFNIDVDQNKAAIGVILHSQDEATRLIDKLTQVQDQIGIGLLDGAKGAKELLAYGISSQDVVHEMTMLNTVGQAVNVTLSDMSYVYGTLKAQGRAYTRDIVQFAMRGIPIYEALSKTMGVPVEQLKNMTSAGKIGFEEIKRAFEWMTSSGGPFGGYLEIHMETLKGKLQILGYEWQMFMGKVAKPMEDPFKHVVVAATSALQRNQGPPFSDQMGEAMNKLAPQINQLMDTLMSFGTFVTAMLNQIAGTFAGLIATFGPLISVLSQLATVLATPIAGGLGFLFVANTMKKSIEDIDKFFSKAMLATEGMNAMKTASWGLGQGIAGIRTALSALWASPGAIFVTALAALAGIGVITFNIISGMEASKASFDAKINDPNSNFKDLKLTESIRGIISTGNNVTSSWANEIAKTLGVSFQDVARKAVEMSAATDELAREFYRLKGTMEATAAKAAEHSTGAYLSGGDMRGMGGAQAWQQITKVMGFHTPDYNAVDPKSKKPVYSGGVPLMENAGINAGGIIDQYKKDMGFDELQTMTAKITATLGKDKGIEFGKVFASEITKDIDNKIKELQDRYQQLEIKKPAGYASAQGLDATLMGLLLQLRDQLVGGKGAAKKQPWEDSTLVEEWQTKLTPTKTDNLNYERDRAVDNARKELHEGKINVAQEIQAIDYINRYYDKEVRLQRSTELFDRMDISSKIAGDEIEQAENVFQRKKAEIELTYTMETERINATKEQRLAADVAVATAEHEARTKALLSGSGSAMGRAVAYASEGADYVAQIELLKQRSKVADDFEKETAALETKLAQQVFDTTTIPLLHREAQLKAILMNDDTAATIDRYNMEEELINAVYEQKTAREKKLADIRLATIAHERANVALMAANKDVSANRSLDLARSPDGQAREAKAILNTYLDTLDSISTNLKLTPTERRAQKAIAGISKTKGLLSINNSYDERYLAASNALSSARIPLHDQDAYSRAQAGNALSESQFGLRNKAMTGAITKEEYTSQNAVALRAFNDAIKSANIALYDFGVGTADISDQFKAEAGQHFADAKGAYGRSGAEFKNVLKFDAGSMEALGKGIGHQITAVGHGFAAAGNAFAAPIAASSSGKLATSIAAGAVSGGPAGILMAVIAHMAESFGTLLAALDPINEAFAPLVQTLTDVFGPVLKDIGTAMTWFADNVIVPAGNAIIWVINGVIDGINNALGWLGVHINRLNYLQTSSELKKATDAVEKFKNQLQGTIDFLKNKINAKFDAMINSLGELLNVGGVSVGEYQKQVGDINQRRQDALGNDTLLTMEQQQVEDLGTLITMYQQATATQEDILGVHKDSVKQQIEAINSLKGQFSLDMAKLPGGIKSALANGNAINPPKGAVKTPTHLAVGTGMVPQDMEAIIHKGEGIIPKDFMSSLRSGELSLSGRKNSTNNSPNAIVNVTVQGSVQKESDLAASIATEIARQRRIGALSV